ncbi:DUF4268 domain-containing protein [Reichenbachiella carrageenanivorans]|uniref:DUF4268 domain-containing protein n=1 Tax=Reichenbachiella carrageenanivorans TaxID=2979869 RepID=A0ABY6CZY5_9BACT|nr:DUF4268 domain-containing protein [Reichenbachiella carrageenanivorans]UXX79487.1 DUF4268 domain-containing protein [Reichenbachiella carrageenanivorans]
MKKTAYGTPFLINNQNERVPLEKEAAIDELSIQTLIFEEPDCLPISDIDESYNPVIPVCTELNTPVGPLDVLLVSPNGEITIVETKLWRNPEARRKVVAQVLDYAKELSNWSYEDLQREINRKLGTKGNTLYELAKSKDPNLTPSEPDFIDSVSRNLSRGKFLLLIAGDGVREGAKGIAEFLSNAGHLNFTFAMVELSIFKAKGLGTLILPKTLVKTIELSKLTVEIPKGLILAQNDDFDDRSTDPVVIDSKKEIERNFYIKFWNELISQLSFDDPGQPMPNPAKGTNLYVYPAQSKKAWISAYFSKSQQKVGVYFRVSGDAEGKAILDSLEDSKEDIRKELGEQIRFNWDGDFNAEIAISINDVFSDSNREEIKDFYKNWLNQFVNVFRPRIKRNGF